MVSLSRDGPPAMDGRAVLLLTFTLCIAFSPCGAWPLWGTLSRFIGTQIQRLMAGRGSSNGSDTAHGKVLNFFPVPLSNECLSNDGRRTGVCLNTYECRIQNGKSFGPCALGFGVCCVFTATCGDTVENNVTYLVSPKFPGLHREVDTCTLYVKKVAPDVSQLRLDFVHFNMGQPNRRTGICDSDMFTIRGGGGSSPELQLCGQNSGQHVYYDVEDAEESIVISMNMSRSNTNRLWEIKVTQLEFQRRAPAGCLQYFQSDSGIIQTMNFAENGRHLANQDYKICMRQERGMCSIVYEPCDENSFKIGPEIPLDDDVGSGAGDGDGGGVLSDVNSTISTARAQCNDKIVMPCDAEDFIPADGSGPGMCDLLHCGTSFCSAGEPLCRIESSTTPFHIHVMFGPAVRDESPEDNLGMCLKFQQQPCMS